MQVYRYVIAGDLQNDEDADDGEQDAVPTPFQFRSFTADVEMISGAQILDVGFTSKGVTAWCLVEPANQAVEVRSFFVCGNGVDLPEGIDAINFRGVAKIVGGPTAHVFELQKVEA